MGTIDYQLRNSSIDVMAEILRTENLEEYIAETLGVNTEEDNEEFGRFFYEHGRKLAIAYLFEEGPGIDLPDALRTSMMTGFLFGLQYQRRFPTK